MGSVAYSLSDKKVGDTARSLILDGKKVESKAQARDKRVKKA